MTNQEMAIRMGAIIKLAETFRTETLLSVVMSQLNRHSEVPFTKDRLRSKLTQSIKDSHAMSDAMKAQQQMSPSGEEELAKYEHELVREIWRVFETIFG